MLRSGLAFGLFLAWPTAAWASSPKLESEPELLESRRPTRLEFGVQLGDYVAAVGSPTQLRYAPLVDLRLAYGLARVGALGFVRLAVPVNLAPTIADEQREFSSGGGLGLRAMVVQRRWFRFGIWLAGTLDRLDSTTVLGKLPGLDEPEHVQRRVTHHAGLEFGQEFGIPLPVPRGPTPVLTLGTALGFVFPIAASRSGTDLADTQYNASQLGVIGVGGGVTALVNLGVMFGWDLPRE